LNAAFALALLGAAALTLAACGRAGPLELPPGPAVAQPGPTAQAMPPVAPSSSVGGPVEQGPTAHETAMRNGFDAYGNPVAPPGQKKSFLLDPLLQ
jgi:predicted small lipoprotein YifL